MHTDMRTHTDPPPQPTHPACIAPCLPCAPAHVAPIRWVLQDEEAYRRTVEEAEAFITKRIIPHIGRIEPAPMIHIFKVGCGGGGSEWRLMCLRASRERPALPPRTYGIQPHPSHETLPAPPAVWPPATRHPTPPTPTHPPRTQYEIDTDSIGELVCRKAAQLGAAAVVLARHDRGRVKEFFLGSVSNYCIHHCRQPVVVHHRSPGA
jgi:hypothetical protein